MAPVFKLTDGTTTLTLSSGSYMVTEYTSGTPDPKTPDEVTETVSLLFVGSTYANNQTAIRAVELMIGAVQRRKLWQAGPRVYLQIQWDGDAENWQTELLDARLEFEDLGSHLRRGKIAADLIITRRWFETVNWTQLTLTNTNGTNNTSGLNVYNGNDGSGSSPNDRVSFVTIDAAEITGSIPAPVKLELTNNMGTAIWLDNLYIGVNSFNDPANFAYTIEGESRTSGGSVIAASGYSGGSAVAITGTGAQTIKWTLGSATVQDCAGMPFRVLAFLYPTVFDGYVETVVFDSTGSDYIYVGDRVEVSTSHPLKTLYDLGVVTIPPGDYSTSYGALMLATRFTFATTQTARVDSLMLLPANTTRRFFCRTASVASTYTVVLDESSERYYIASGAAEYPYMQAYGQPMVLQPGVTSRIYFAWDNNTGFDVSRYFSVKGWFKARRWTI